MRIAPLFSIGLVVAVVATAAGQDAPHVIQNVEVFNEPGRFAGWPANNGIWSWGDEIVVGFTLGYHKDVTSGHTIDRERPSEPQQARSLDGGQTWTIEGPSYVGEDGKARKSVSLSSPIDFSHPDFAARFRTHQFSYSFDRCRTWQGPFELPTFGRPGLLARTDYLVEGKHRLTAFVAAQKQGGNEGQPLCIRTTDGAKTWKLVGWIGQQPPASYGYAIMPATVALDGDSYLSIIRRSGVFNGEKRWWLEAFLSPDDGRSWYRLDQPQIDNAGNPATLNRLEDGRIALVYGWRHAPYGIRSRLSSDDGATWGPEIILRADGRTWDLGYPRTVQRADGNLVTAYYFNDTSQVGRFIAATIWSPGKAGPPQH
ncbi:MAG: exo-alpha-sialidase [Pirellulales bacterium]